MVQSFDPSQQIEHLKLENDMLLHHLHQIQQELEHYYLLATQDRALAVSIEPSWQEDLIPTAESERRARERAEKVRDAILRSTSWRVTAPLRWLLLTLTRQRHQQDAPSPPDFSSAKNDHKERIRLEKSIDDLLSSTSWRITAPLRWRPWRSTESDLEFARLPRALGRASDHRSNLERALTTATAERDRLKSALTAATAERESLKHALTTTADERNSLKRALETVTAERDVLRQSLATAQEGRKLIDNALSEFRNDQQRALTNLGHQLESFIRLQAYLGADFLVPELHAWPISPDLAVMIIRLINRGHYDAVVEFGSGVSTSIIAKALSTTEERILAKPTPFLSVEHLQTYFDQTALLLDDAELRSRVTLVLSPLKEYIGPDGYRYMYYDCADALSRFRDQISAAAPKVLVLVDGPPAATGAHARYPALPHLLQAFQPRGDSMGPGTELCLDILVDDYNRTDERAMIGQWESLLRLRRIPSQKEVFLQLEKQACLLKVGTSGS
jgi:hypothetical protein